jgi:tRNA nucleotidyltransferase (CCA-adding enzyme)
MRINEVILHEEMLDVKSVVTSSIKKLDKVFKNNNYELRIVGGAVRDIALGKLPKDIDLATDATPDEMIAILDKANIKHIPTGIDHGTITAILGKEPFEITTLRADTETDGRHAEVEFVTNWEEDAKRRDLTYNAMSMDMEGNVFDYFNGMDDLQDKVSKFVGDAGQRIQEDYLRILRYFRFQGRLSTPTWNEDTLKAISSNVKGLQQISAERVWQEMSKVLSGQNIANVLDHMTKSGVSKVIGLSTNDLNKVKDKGNSIVALAQMGNNVDIAKRWRLSNNEAVLLDFLIKNKTNTLDKKKVEDMIADGVDKNLISALATLQGKEDMASHVSSAKVPDFPITGSDLIAKGMNPGPEMGAKLNLLKQQWKQSNFTATKDELLKEVKEFVTLRKGDQIVRVPKSRLEFYLGQHYELVEKITKSTPMGDVIKDFYKSDAPQFKGKSKAKKRQMAIAAKLSTTSNKFEDNASL